MRTQPPPPASSSFLRRHVPALGKEVHRLGLAASHGLDERGAREALELGRPTSSGTRPRAPSPRPCAMPCAVSGSGTSSPPARPWGSSRAPSAAGDCYRFCLTSPHVDVVLCSPASVAQLREDLAALERGPLSDEELTWMRAFGRVVHG